MKFNESQLTSMAKDLKKNDVSKLDKTKVLTSDEFLFEISTIKEKLNKELLTNVKESSMDCSIHSTSSSKEQITCFRIGNANENMMYVPNIQKQDNDKVMQLNKKEVAIKLYKIKDTKYGVDKETNKIYNYEDFKANRNIIPLGSLVMENGKNKIVFD